MKGNLIKYILYSLPIISALVLFFEGSAFLVFRGLIFVIITIVIWVLLWPLEKKILQIFPGRIIMYLSPIYNFVLVTLSIILTWFYINALNSGNIWVFIFSLTCCYLPYNYMLEGEFEISKNVGLVTITLRNYSLVGYLFFGILMNFTNIPFIWALVPLCLIGYLFFYYLPLKFKENLLDELIREEILKHPKI